MYSYRKAVFFFWKNLIMAGDPNFFLRRFVQLNLFLQRSWSGSVTIIGDFWQPFCVGKNNGGHKARTRKMTIAREKRHLLDSAWAGKLFARLTELSESDINDTCASSRHFLLAQKKAQKITENCDTAPLKNRGVYVQTTWLLSCPVSM